MRNFVQPGNAVTVPSPRDVASGEGILIDRLFGVAGTDAPSGGELVLHCEGVYDLPKATGEAFTLGNRVYWDATDGECTTASEDNFLIGVCVEAAGSAAPILRVRLTGVLN